jgi:hypothetical protein
MQSIPLLASLPENNNFKVPLDQNMDNYLTTLLDAAINLPLLKLG